MSKNKVVNIFQANLSILTEQFGCHYPLILSQIYNPLARSHSGQLRQFRSTLNLKSEIKHGIRKKVNLYRQEMMVKMHVQPLSLSSPAISCEETVRRIDTITSALTLKTETGR